MISSQLETVKVEQVSTTIKGEDLYHLLHVLRMKEDEYTNPYLDENGQRLGGFLYNAILDEFEDDRYAVEHDMLNWAKEKGLRE